MWRRLWAIVIKEALQLIRDKMTFGMMFGLPIMQLLLFGYAIDTDPHNLPTAVIAADDSTITRSVLGALRSTGYMAFTHRPQSEAEANSLLQRGEVADGAERHPPLRREIPRAMLRHAAAIARPARDRVVHAERIQDIEHQQRDVRRLRDVEIGRAHV